MVRQLGSAATPTGFEISYYDYTTNVVETMTVGEGSPVADAAGPPAVPMAN